jgi:hypothetical protein
MTHGLTLAAIVMPQSLKAAPQPQGAYSSEHILNNNTQNNKIIL